MRIRELSLENYRCFETATLALDPGVTVIYGPNGSGKTTLFEAILFALYGSGGLAEATLEDVVTRGAEAASVTMEFDHGDERFHLEREVVVRDERAATRRCVLDRGDDEPIEGARAVSSFLVDRLRLDAQAFVNSAYVKQGEIDRFLHATPAERQSMLDDLLRLGVLETYHDRADEARLAVRSLAREREERLDELAAQLEPLRERDLHDRLNELETEREQVRAELEELTDRRHERRSERDAIEDELETLEERRAERAELEERRAEIAEAIEEAEAERQSLRERREALRESRADLEATIDEQIDDLGIDGIDSLGSARSALESDRDDLEAELEELRDTIESATASQAEAGERIDSLEAQLAERRDELAEVRTAIEEDEDALADHHDRREAVQTEIDELGEAIDDWPLDEEALDSARASVTEDRDELEATLQETRERIAALEDLVERAEELAAADRCPTCGQPVAEAPHVERLEEDREELDELREEVDELTDELEAREDRLERLEAIASRRERLESLEALIDQREATLEERRERETALEAAIEELQSTLQEATAARESATETVESARARVGEINDRLADLREREEDLDALEDLLDRRDDIDDERERLADRRDHLAELIDARHDRLGDVDERLAELTEAVDADRIATLEERREELADDLTDLDERIADLEERRDELNERIGSVRTDLDQLETLEERRETIEQRHDALDALRREASELGELYESVRAELRERNVTALERSLNDTFGRLYRNEAYDRIDLAPDYTVDIVQHDGTALRPDDLSGGERALFNLSLRWAIYRLLATGVDGGASMPPLMLDEPTVFLDDGHVRRLLRLFEAVREAGVAQTLVVSHHETLLDAADQRVAVEKHPTTNRSSVHPEVAPEPP